MSKKFAGKRKHLGLGKLMMDSVGCAIV